jgi:DNA-binding transcriptional regulator YdaS (Cro superfamily)
MYKIKKEISIQIKNKYLVEKLGFSNAYVSQLLKRKRACPLHTAFAIASLYGYKYDEINELFEKVGE